MRSWCRVWSASVSRETSGSNMAPTYPVRRPFGGQEVACEIFHKPLILTRDGAGNAGTVHGQGVQVPCRRPPVRRWDRGLPVPGSPARSQAEYDPVVSLDRGVPGCGARGSERVAGRDVREPASQRARGPVTATALLGVVLSAVLAALSYKMCGQQAAIAAVLFGLLATAIQLGAIQLV